MTDAFVAATPRGAPRVLSALGVEIAILTGEGPDGPAMTVMRYLAPPNFLGPPMHIHTLATEWFHVLDGAMRLEVGGEAIGLGPGGFAEVPRGTPHRWRNAGAAPLVFLFGFDRPGMGRYFEEVFALALREPQWPPTDPSRLEAIARRYDQISA